MRLPAISANFREDLLYFDKTYVGLNILTKSSRIGWPHFAKNKKTIYQRGSRNEKNYKHWVRSGKQCADLVDLEACNKTNTCL